MTTKWALVPVEPIDRPSFCDRGESTACCFREDKEKYCCADREQERRDAKPGAALLAEVLAARDTVKASPYSIPDMRLYVRLLAALDKLGPAAEGAT